MKAEIGTRYVHYKNKKEYVVLALAVHTETMKAMVVYEGQYTDAEFGEKPVWVRPQKMFEEEVKFEGELVHRFARID